MSLFWPFQAAASLWRERKTKRSPKWRALEKHFLSCNPYCAGCGGKLLLQAHHVVPVHVDAERELEWGNLLALCMGPRTCHFALGHHSNWKDYNPSVRLDARRQLDSLRRGRRP